MTAVDNMRKNVYLHHGLGYHLSRSKSLEVPLILIFT